MSTGSTCTSVFTVLFCTVTASLALEPVTVFPDSSTWGHHVESAVDKLESGSPLDIVIFGQSVSERIRPNELAAKLKEMYPSANLTVRNISRGACSASATLCDNNCICAELKNSPDKLAAFQEADLVIQHVYGWEGGFITLYDFFQQNLKPGAEVAVWNDHAPVGDTTADHGSTYNRYCARLFKREQCASRGWALIDVMTPWYAYLTQYGVGPQALLIDGVHPNTDGSELLETLLASYFVDPSNDKTAPRLERVEAKSRTRFVLTFSEALDPVSAQQTGNYSCTGGATVTSAALLPFGDEVILTTTPAAPGDHTITVSTITDRSPNANAIDPAASSGTATVADTYGWAWTDIGTCGGPGSTVWDGASCTITSSADATNEYKHECHYTFVPAYGDCEITARLAQQDQFVDNGQVITNTMAGVAVRGNDRYHSSFALVGLNAGGGLDFFHRNDLSGRVTRKNTGVRGKSAPLWLRMSRTGEVIEAFYSDDGSGWTSLGTVSVGMGGEVTIGLFAVGGKYNLTNSARFSDVAVEAGHTAVTVAGNVAACQGGATPLVTLRNDVLRVGVPGHRVRGVEVFRLDGALADARALSGGAAAFHIPWHGRGVTVVRVETVDGTGFSCLVNVRETP